MTFFDIVRQTVVGMYASNAELLKVIFWAVCVPLIAVGFVKWHKQLGDLFMDFFELQGYGVIIRDPDNVVQEKNREYYENLKRERRKEVEGGRKELPKRKIQRRPQRKPMRRV